MANPTQDTWVDVKQPEQSQTQDEWQDVPARTPADATPQIQDAQWGAQNPYLRAMQDTANQGPGMLAKGLYNAVPGLSSNVPKPFADMMANYHPENVKTNPVANVGAQVEEGIGSMAGMLPFATPLTKAAGMLPMVGNAGKLGLGGITAGGLGFGATNAAQAAGNGQPMLPAAAQGFGQGMAYGAGGAIGQGLGKLVGQPLIGQALGMAGAGATLAPSGQKISGAILGGGFGMDRGLGDPQQMIDNEGQKLYRGILNPGKGIINKLEIKSGKDVNDSMNLAAQHGLILDSNEGKLDNLGAIEQAKQLAKPYYQKLDQILSQNQSTVPGKGGFDLQDLGAQVKKSFDDPNSPGYIKNAQDAAQAKSKVDALIQAEIDRPGVGQYVNAQKLNTIKQGMWEKSYNPLEPNANDAARQVGFGIKDLIEQAYPNDDIKGLNAQTGRYLTLQKVLEQTHGQVVKGGKLGNHLAAGASGIIGALAGSHIPIPVVGEMIGGAVGGFAGENISKFANDPNRLTTSWANKLNAAKQAAMPVAQNPVMNPMGQSRNPNVMNAELVPRKIGASMNPISGALGYDRVGAYGASRMAQEQPGMTTPVFRTSGMPINQPANPGALGLSRLSPNPSPLGVKGGEPIGPHYTEPNAARVIAGSQSPIAMPESKYAMRETIPNPNVKPEDMQDFKDMYDWESNMNPGGRKTFGGSQSNPERTAIYSNSGHSQAFVNASGNSHPAGMDLLSRAANGERLTKGEQGHIQKMIEDYRQNVKPSVQGIGQGTSSQGTMNPLFGNKESESAWTD